MRISDWSSDVCSSDLYVKHHVKEEENEYFPRVRAAGLDLQGLAERMQRLKTALLERQPPRVTADTVDFAPRTPGPVSLHRPSGRACASTPAFELPARPAVLQGGLFLRPAWILCREPASAGAVPNRSEQ